MVYSQKYCLVSFINPIDKNFEFIMDEWPLHITLVDVFAIDRIKHDIDRKVSQLLANIAPIKVTASNEAVLGNTDVVLLENNNDLQKLHESLINLLENNQCIFNSPEFNNDGFLPHCTIQNSKKLHKGEVISIDSIALIDMFVNGDWRKRKVLNVFKLNNT